MACRLGNWLSTPPASLPASPCSVGDQLRFGESSRLYVLGGPKELMPEEGPSKEDRMKQAALKVSRFGGARPASSSWHGVQHTASVRAAALQVTRCLLASVYARCAVQAMAARREREEQVSKAQMEAALG